MRATWVDGMLLAPLLIASFIYLRSSPEFAANLPQDAVDFVVPALNFVERGSIVTSCYGRDYGPAHPFGMPLLLAPAYLIFGRFPGNGIYAILFFALAAIMVVYFIGRQLGGRLCGCIAAMFLATHHGFHEYAGKIMSEVPSIFLLALIFLWLLRLRGSNRTIWGYCGIGALAGFAIAVRWDNVLVLVPVLALLFRDSLKSSIKRVACVCIGLIPWFAALGFYNHTHFGGPLRTGYHYWGSAGTGARPLFSLRYATARGYWGNHGNPEGFVKAPDGNLMLSMKTLFDEADITLTFSSSPRWGNKPRHMYQAFVIARTMLGLIGLAWCFRWWRRRPSAQAAGLWFISFSIAMIPFYSSYFWQEERFLLRLVPFFCVLNAIGPAALLASIQEWRSPGRAEATFGVTVLVCGLMSALAYFSASKLVPQCDDNLQLYQEMHSASSIMESNAVVVTDWDPFRPNLYIIKGTQRTLIPLSKDARAPFVASEEPGKLVALSRQGSPVYLLLRDPASIVAAGLPTRSKTPYKSVLHGQTPSVILAELPTWFQEDQPALVFRRASAGELATLWKYFQYEPLLTFKDADGQPLWAYFHRLHALPSPPTIN